MPLQTDAVEEKPLDGVRVLDLTRVLAGPFCTMILADLGAEVIKVEEIEQGDPSRAVYPFVEGVSHFDLSINRNKKAIAVDVRTSEGKEIVLDLVRKSDVVVENFRPDVMDRLGLSVDALRAVNPDVIVCSISGFGKSNSSSNKPAFDIIVQALSGIMSVNGEEQQGPLKLGVSLGDIGAGLWGAISVLAALNGRNKTGKPASIDLSMLDSLIALLSYMTSYAFITGKSFPQTGNINVNVVPYGRFPVKDGYIILALHLGHFWRKFCTAVGKPEWMDDPRFRKAEARRTNRVVLEAEMIEILRHKTASEWLAIFDEHDLPSAPVLDVAQALAQPIVAERELIKECDHLTAGTVRVVGSPLKFGSQGASTSYTAAPVLGQHTFEVLEGLLGYGAGQMQELARKSVIRSAQADCAAASA